jgi:diguanylate cyclase (GGDEF)-like protein
MTNKERELVRELTARLAQLLEWGLTKEPFAGEIDDPALAELSVAIDVAAKALGEAQVFLTGLAAGELGMEPPPANQFIAPFKRLHAHLRHLTRQTQEIAAGDLDQRVDFLGEFSVAFNSLIDALREKRAVEEQIHYLSFHDSLTGLYNRTYFEEELARMEKGRRFPVSILAADLDGLKEVNDTLGHSVGDRLIQSAARILEKGVRAENVVARIGGDEFVIIFPNTGESVMHKIVARIRHNEAVFNAGQDTFSVGISLGTATAESTCSLRDILMLADRRMYVDKEQRKKSSVNKRP